MKIKSKYDRSKLFINLMSLVMFFCSAGVTMFIFSLFEPESIISRIFFWILTTPFWGSLLFFSFLTIAYINMEAMDLLDETLGKK